MKNWFKGVAAAVLVAAGSVPATAAVLTQTFNFAGSSGSINYGNALTFSQGSGASQIQVRATAWTATASGSGYNYTNAFLTQFSQGLGVISRTDSNGNGNLHTIDNVGSFDFIVFQFSRAVEVSTASLTPFSVSGSIDNDSTTQVGGTMTAWNSAINFASQSTLNSLFGATKYDVEGNGTSALIDLNPSNVAGNLFLVSASQTRTGNPDGFKLNTLKVTAPVPEPATWAMMISGFGLIGAGMRRRIATITYA